MRFSIYYLIFIFSIHYIYADHVQLFNNKCQLSIEKIVTDLTALQEVARSTLSFIREHENKHWFKPVKKGLLETQGITFKDVKKTLSFIIWVIENDKGKPNQRMLNPEFLRKHFTLVQWLPDLETAHKRGVYLEQDKLRITKYLIYQAQGSYKKTNDFPCALYEVKEKDKNILEKFTKQDVLAGALNKEKRAKPLVWLSRNDLEEALMQGTIYVTMPDNKVRVFNVENNNGIAYDQKLKNKREQKRYWSFKELGKMGPDINHKIKIMPGATFAGDIHSLGIGKIIALQYDDVLTGKNTMRFGVLADTGGAFENNLYQLDFFTGIFPSRKVFAEKTKEVPSAAKVYFLKKIMTRGSPR